MALLHVDFFSESLGMCTQMDVILPEDNKGPYPTLYLLHGMGDDHTIWQRRTDIEHFSYAAKRGLAVVMPTTHLGWYTDMHKGYKYFTYIAKELVETCRNFFPGMSRLREDTFAAGNSMGGYGALKLGLLASETFARVAPLSAGYDPKELYETMLRGEDDKRYWADIFGPPESFCGTENDLFGMARWLVTTGKPKPDIFMWCGTEDFLYRQNIQMRDHLQKLGYSVTYGEAPGGHSWELWKAKIKDVIEWLEA